MKRLGIAIFWLIPCLWALNRVKFDSHSFDNLAKDSHFVIIATKVTLKHYSQCLQERGRRTFIQSCRQHSVLAGKGQGQAYRANDRKRHVLITAGMCYGVNLQLP